MINKNEDEEMLQLDHNVGQWPMIPTSEHPLLTGIIEKRKDFQGRDIWLNVFLDSADGWNCYLAREALKFSK